MNSQIIPEKTKFIEKPEQIIKYIEKPEIIKIKKVVEIEKYIISNDPNDITLYL